MGVTGRNALRHFLGIQTIVQIREVDTHLIRYITFISQQVEQLQSEIQLRSDLTNLQDVLSFCEIVKRLTS